MSKNRSAFGPMLLQGSVWFAFGIACLPAGPAWAQQAEGAQPAVEELPDVVVEGATLDTAKARPKPAKKAAKAVPAESAVVAKPKPAPKPAAAAPSKPKPQEPVEEPATSAGTSDALPDTAAQAGTEADESQSGGVAIDRLGTAVAVVSGADLKARQIRHAGDAIRSLPGVHVSRSNGVTGLTQVRIRGAEGNHTLVLIDGIEANDATNGEYDFSDLSTEDIERIEVIRGPQSSIYGAGALGGVINIVTKGGKGPLTFRAHGETGTFGTRDGGFSASAGSDDIWGRVSYSRHETGGFNISPVGPENDGGNLSTFAFKGGIRLFQDLTLDVSLRRTDKDGSRDTEGVELGKLQAQTDDPAVFNAKTWMQGARLTWEAFDGALTQSVSANSNETHRTDHSPNTFFDSDYLGETITYAYTGTARFEVPVGLGLKHSVTWLVEDEKESFTPNSFSYDPGPFAFNFSDDGFARVRNRTAYAGEWRGDFADRLIVTAGVRRDDNDTFEDFTTWRTTATLRLPEIGLRPHGSAGTAVKAPTMFEQYGAIPTFFTPNPALIPEESFGWDAGLELATRDRRHLIDVTYFEANLENKIDGLAPGPNFTFTGANLEGISRRKGIEVAASTEIVTGLTLSGSYTYLEAIRPDGLDELRRPRHAGRADLNYAFDAGKGNFNVGAIYNGEMDDAVRRVTDILVFPGFGSFPVLRPERFRLDEYLVVNVAASYKVLPGVELYGRLENAFDEEYQEVFGFETADVAGYVGVRLTGVVEETRAWSEGR